MTRQKITQTQINTINTAGIKYNSLTIKPKSTTGLVDMVKHFCKQSGLVYQSAIVDKYIASHYKPIASQNIASSYGSEALVVKPSIITPPCDVAHNNDNVEGAITIKPKYINEGNDIMPTIADLVFPKLKFIKIKNVKFFYLGKGNYRLRSTLSIAGYKPLTLSVSSSKKAWFYSGENGYAVAGRIYPAGLNEEFLHKSEVFFTFDNEYVQELNKILIGLRSAICLIEKNPAEPTPITDIPVIEAETPVKATLTIPQGNYVVSELIARINDILQSHKVKCDKGILPVINLKGGSVDASRLLKILKKCKSKIYTTIFIDSHIDGRVAFQWQNFTFNLENHANDVADGVKPIIAYDFIEVAQTVSVNSTISVNRVEFVKHLKNSIYFNRTDKTRYYLNGTCLDFNGNSMVVVATDGRKMYKAKLDCTNTNNIVKQTIISTSYVKLLVARLSKINDETIAISFDDDISITINGQSYQLVDGTFPDYNRPIPKDSSKAIKVNRKALIAAVKSVASVSEDKTKLVKYAFSNNSITLTSQGREADGGKDFIDADYQGDAFEIGFDSNYMIGIMSVCTDTDAKLELEDKDSPAIITFASNPNALIVLTPMRF
jgi:DNA polymerase III sliding clamp (beta) subunit (PCNA family)